MRDMRMIERGQEFGFAVEASQGLGMAREFRGENLDRDIAFLLRVARAIDLAHSACPDGCQNYVRADL